VNRLEPGRGIASADKQQERFRYFKTSPESIRLAVMLCVRFPLSLRNGQDLVHKRGIEVSHQTGPFWWNRFGTLFAAGIRRKRVERRHAGRQLRCHLWQSRTARPCVSSASACASPSRPISP